MILPVFWSVDHYYFIELNLLEDLKILIILLIIYFFILRFVWLKFSSVAVFFSGMMGND